MEENLLEYKTSGLSLKEFHDKCLDVKMVFETFFRKGSPFQDDSIDQKRSCLIKIFSSGRVQGNTMIQLTMAPFIHHILAACECFTEIIIGTGNDSCLQELENWRKNEPNAIDMSHAAQRVCDGEDNRETWMEKQNMLQSKVKQVLIYDITKSNPFSPVVMPQADCLLLSHCLEVQALDKEAFCSALKNVSTLLKPGGNLIMIVLRETTFYMVGKFKFPHLCIDQDFLRKKLTDTGYIVEELKVLQRKVVGLVDYCDYNAAIVINARKNAEG